MSEVETDLPTHELNLEGALRRKAEGGIYSKRNDQSALQKGLERKADPRRAEGGRLKQMPRGRKRAMSERDTGPLSHEMNSGEVPSREASRGSNAVVSESCGLAPLGPALKVQEVAKPAVSSEGRPSKRRKIDGKISWSKRSCAGEKTCQADLDVEEVKLFASKEGGDSEEATRRQPIKWKLELRPALKKILEKDLEMVMGQGKRHRLPASPNIIQLLDQFVKDASLGHLSALEKLQSR